MCSRLLKFTLVLPNFFSLKRTENTTALILLENFLVIRGETLDGQSRRIWTADFQAHIRPLKEKKFYNFLNTVKNQMQKFSEIDYPRV